MQAKKGAKEIPYLVMCSTHDPRFDIARQFAQSLENEGFKVQTKWPETPHGNRAEFLTEFQKYAHYAGEFFRSIIEDK